jgi:2-polyprenyl-3-methyl-5-hydroxy-6-metoxy-1,4-benzoquinol methylase
VNEHHPSGDPDDEARLAENRATWDRWVDLNYTSDFYDVESFKRGRSTLDEIERAGVGDVAGKRLLHLQCHFGMDTLSWARLGAEVTGVDFSARAIETARGLADELGIEAEFVQCSVDSAPYILSGAETYDVVFTSYGAISWLPRLAPWAETIAYFLKPGGIFFVADHHPTAWIFDDDDPTPGLRYKYPYFSREAMRDEAAGNYARPDAPERSVSHSWQHTFEEVVGSLLDEGLTILQLREYDRCAWAWFEWMERGDDGFWRMPDDHGDIPLMFSVTATK